MPIIFYVYVLRDPRPGKNEQPIYVGKGQGNRANYHFRKAKVHDNPLLRRVLTKIRAVSLKPLVSIENCRDEADAYQREIDSIAQFGRRDLGTGSLCNLTSGGEGSDGGIFRKLHADPEFRKKHSDRARAHIEKLNTPEHRAQSSDRMRRLHYTNPEFIEALIKRNADPVFQAKRIAAVKAAFAKRRAAQGADTSIHCDEEPSS